MSEPGEPDVLHALLRRVRRALMREPQALPLRCAWCGRVAVGDRWTPLEELPVFVPHDLAATASHGICPDCVAELEREGKSRPVRRGPQAPS